MADMNKIYKRAVDVIGVGHVTDKNRQQIAIYAGLVYIGDSLKEAIEQAPLCLNLVNEIIKKLHSPVSGGK